jgi:hypothetical protein
MLKVRITVLEVARAIYCLERSVRYLRLKYY